MDGPSHLLSLKVMRLSRPALATAWEPFYSSSPSFSAHSTASVLSLQGKAPLSGHPKTLRDLTNASELLTLPASFGAIQLGETFSGVLAVNNETAATVDGVLLRVEMQTAANKVLLCELGGPLQSLAAGDTLEVAVSHEIKELGQHVLICSVTYKPPPGSRQPAPVPEIGDPTLQTFRKFYKFSVTNPLSVKTKVHVPRSPAGMLSREEREKVFLEVHIQNMTPEPMSFERIFLEPAPGWNVTDVNFDLQSTGEKESLFSGAMSMMQPQDARQYLYILSPIDAPGFAIQPAPGAIAPLGRLDISWRSSFGEPGRLLTSMLSRRIPLITPAQATVPRQQPASALPLHLQRTQSGISQPPSRPGTPPIASPTTAVPYRPASPRVRPMSVTSVTSTPVQPLPLPVSLPEPLNIDLVVIHALHDPVPVDVPVRLKFALGLSATVPDGRRRIVSLAVQHVQLSSIALRPPQPPQLLTSPRATHAALSSVSSLQLSRIMSAPAPSLDHQALSESPRIHTADLSELARMLPRPVPLSGDEEKYSRLTGAKFFGMSVQLLSPLIIEADGAPTFTDFEMCWVPLQRGFVRLGGLRLIIVEDSIVDPGMDSTTTSGATQSPRIVKEWDVVGEIWVS